MKCHSTSRAPILLVLVSVLALVSVAWGQAAQAPAARQDIGNSGGSGVSSVVLGTGTYNLGPGDLVAVTIYGDPELSRDCRISGDGHIVLALLRERVVAAGKTPEQLQDAISDAYVSEGILKNPQPTVRVLEFRSSPVTILGAVVHPSTIQVAGTINLLQAIAAVGDFTRDAGGNIQIVRPAGVDADGKPIPKSTILIRQRDLYQKSSDPTVNIPLKGGDIVSVARTEYIWVGGAVNAPHMLPMTDVPNWTIITALVAAGNASKFAKLDHSFILRAKADGGREWIPVHLKKVLNNKEPDQPLIANDILLVPNSYGKEAMSRAMETVFSASQSLLILGATGVP